MGLSVQSYSHLEYVRPGQPNDREWDDEDYIGARAYDVFPASVRGLANADVTGHGFIAESVYRVTPETDTYYFPAGSYGGYGAWRNTLADFAHYPKDHSTADPGSAFYELIWFADNEGCIGPDAALDLYCDFVAYRDDFTKYVKDRFPFETWAVDRYVKVYEDFAAAFRLGMNDGLVSFQ